MAAMLGSLSASLHARIVSPSQGMILLCKLLALHSQLVDLQLALLKGMPIQVALVL